jgi:ubiquinone/menaquinone biosynthesis C-methylase UbiE
MTSTQDDYAGTKGRFYRAYIRRPRVARLIGSVLWGSDFRPLYRHLARLSTLPQGTTVVDAACGAGLSLEWLDPTRHHHYVGVDLSPSMLEAATRVASERGFTDVTLHLGDAASMPLSDGQAEVGLTYNALHCLPDPRAALSELARCVAPQGTILGSTLVKGGSTRADRILAADTTMGPGGTAKELEGWLVEAGMSDIHMEESNAMVVFAARR